MCVGLWLAHGYLAINLAIILQDQLSEISLAVYSRCLCFVHGDRFLNSNKYIYVCVCVYLALYIIRHILQWSQEAKEINIDLLLPDHWSQYQFQPLCRTQVSPMPEEMHAPNIWSAIAFLCNKFVFLSVCACSVCMPSCKICGLFSQFDAIYQFIWGWRFGALPEDRWWGLDYRRRLCWRSLFRIHPSGSLQFG